MTGEAHASALASLQHELGVHRARGGISEQFEEWHRRLMACLETIANEVPSCADMCEDLKAIDYELPPEIEQGIPQGLPVDPIMTHGQRVYFRKQCDRADEVMRTLLWSLAHSSNEPG
jgi:hypothetical protein